MSIKNLDILFNPKRIAVIGASENDKSAGYYLLKNLIGKGFKGIVHPIHATMNGLQGVETYKSLSSIPHPIDLAMVATDPENLPTVLRDCAQKGVKGLIILGPDSLPRHSTSLSELIRKLSSSYGCRVVGPTLLVFSGPPSTSTPVSTRNFLNRAKSLLFPKAVVFPQYSWNTR